MPHSKQRQILLRAAELIASRQETYCCNAIRRARRSVHASYEETKEAVSLLEWLFKPNPNITVWWISFINDPVWYSDRELREARIIALLIAAEES
jgi:hypothetical protein